MELDELLGRGADIRLGGLEVVQEGISQKVALLFKNLDLAALSRHGRGRADGLLDTEAQKAATSSCRK